MSLPRCLPISLSDQVLLEQLLLDPDRQGVPERREATRREGEVGLEQALELQERLVVEGDVIDVLGRDSGRLEAIARGVDREAGIVLLAREAFLLRRCDDLSIHHQRRRRVVIEGRQSEYLHVGSAPQKIV